MRATYLDSLRGMAVLWMMIFHASYDLRMYQLVSWDFDHGFWFVFPRLIAFTFLFCVGISLHYGHSPKIRWEALKSRSIRLGLAAVSISVVTYFIFPTQWIYFGTLHCIFFGSLFGALVVNHRRIAWTLLLTILTLQYLLHFDIKWLSSILQKPSMDFIPIYPWFWTILAGIISAPYLSRITWLQKMPRIASLEFFGRHSLKIYLLHQPLLFGVISGINLLKMR